MEADNGDIFHHYPDVVPNSSKYKPPTEQDGHVAPDMLDARLATLELRLVKWTVGTGIAVAGIVIAFLRLIG